LPLMKRHPVRQRYRMVELQRWRDKRGQKFHLSRRTGRSMPGLRWAEPSGRAVHRRVRLAGRCAGMVRCSGDRTGSNYSATR
jgi:hypothetical protein